MNEYDDPTFEPGLNVLCHVMRVILEKNSIEKTGLSREVDIQYAVLLKHLEWLEKKRLVESVIEEGRTCFKPTSKGREFATLISMLCD